MIRTLIACSALSAILATAAPASAESAIVVTLTGKNAADAFAAITAAAHSVCVAPGYVMALDYDEDCVRDTVARAVARANNPSLTQYAQTREARLQLASN